MKKLLHEKLREYALTEHYIFKGDGYRVAALNYDEAVGLANEIERYYIPRPRFEDGEVVKRGDKIEVEGITSKVDGIRVVADRQDSDETMFYLHNGIMVGRATSIPVKRPQPKVLDADGMEINVGDTVWHKHSGYKGEVQEIKLNAEHCINVKWENGFQTNYMPEVLTHKEPDSLEKLRYDMEKFRANTHFASLETEKPFDKFLDRLTALIEREA